MYMGSAYMCYISTKFGRQPHTFTLDRNIIDGEDAVAMIANIVSISVKLMGNLGAILKSGPFRNMFAGFWFYVPFYRFSYPTVSLL